MNCSTPLTLVKTIQSKDAAASQAASSAAVFSAG